jgi:hypothetical protein
MLVVVLQSKFVAQSVGPVQDVLHPVGVQANPPTHADEHVPTSPGTSHASHAPSQAVSQHTPSTQNPLAQSEPTMHGACPPPPPLLLVEPPPAPEPPAPVGWAYSRSPKQAVEVSAKQDRASKNERPTRRIYHR